MKTRTFADMLATRPHQIIEKAVKGMLPHTRLGRQQASKLKVYAGPNHPHQAQQPVPFEITQVAQ
jgi:large subunit ribosomal protein L13